MSSSRRLSFYNGLAENGWLPERGEKIDLYRLAEDAVEMMRDGYSLREVAEEAGYPLHCLRRIIRKHGLSNGEVAL